MAVELPEAITLARQMNAVLKRKKIAEVHLDKRSDSLVRQGFINLPKINLAGRIVKQVTSKGKWIYLRLVPDLYLLFALETGGKFLFHSKEEPPPEHYHVMLCFANGSSLTEHIVGWGWAKAAYDPESERYPGKLGLSPVDGEKFKYEKFCRILDEGGKKNIKFILLEQNKIAGIGNGYLQDILFRACLRPDRKVGDLTGTERLSLYNAIRSVLGEAVRLGGSELECDLYNCPGRYRRILGEFRLGKPCPNCGTEIEKVRVQGSSSYICPSCQK